MMEVDHYYEMISVTEDCTLRNLIKGKGKEYDRGCAYYEYIDKDYDIDFNNEVLLMNEVSIINFDMQITYIEPTPHACICNT